jgi:hypothetical protein
MFSISRKVRLRVVGYHPSLPDLSQVMVCQYPNCSLRSKSVIPRHMYNDSSTLPSPPQVTQSCQETKDFVTPTSSNQPLPLPLIHYPLTLVLALSLRSIRRVEQIVHITSHAASTGRWRRINPFEREPWTRQLPPAFIVARIIAATAIARVVAESTACGRFV